MGRFFDRAEAIQSPTTVVLSGGVNLHLVSIKPKTFMMGSPSAERGRSDRETQHVVTLSRAFQLGKYPVTQKQWQAVTGYNPSYFNPPNWKSCNSDCPVESVSWTDCQQFISRLNTLLKGMEFRLPTEAEWEYACRAGTLGAKYGDLDKIAWYARNSLYSTHPVGQKEPNAWGLYDMIGNVFEWCQDWTGNYPSEPVVDPQGPSSGSTRICRGSSWRQREFAAFGPISLRSAHRDGDYPSTRRNNLGLRLARTL
jgi:formylglycine-generating enzyme required for sulfatase activity